MKKKSSPSTNMSAMVFAIAVGTVSEILLALAGAAIGASVINRGMIGENGASIIALITWFISSAVGTLLSGRLEKNRVLPVVLITAGIYILFLFGLKTVLFDVPFDGIGKGIITILIGVLPSILLLTKQKNGKKIKFRYSPK